MNTLGAICSESAFGPFVNIVGHLLKVCVVTPRAAVFDATRAWWNGSINMLGDQNGIRFDAAAQF
jgi:hypothetical protein